MITTGTKLGAYEILSQIGAGGMGEVYRARDPKLGRDVAIKVLPEAFARDAERMARFQREAKVLASLSHPNIATIYGLEDSGSTHALVMELVEGPTLADRIKAGPIPVDESVRIARQIADALEYAHERGIIHRDLKPANVKVTNDDAVKVLDFGLAKALEGDPSSIDISTSPTISRKVLSTAGERGVYLMPALSPDGRQAVVVRATDAQNGKYTLWLVDMSRTTTTRFTFGPADVQYPIWSPDGSRIIFTSNRDGTYDLYQKPASGAQDEEPLLKSNEIKLANSISRDGRFLMYAGSEPNTKYGLWVLPLMGEHKPLPFLRTQFDEVAGHFSPDGHWVAYVSGETEQGDIYVRRFSQGSASAEPDSGGKWQVSYSGGVEPRWRPDGKELYYLTPDWKLMAVEVSTDPVFRTETPKLLFQAPQQPYYTEGDYTVDGKRFLFLAPVGQTGQAPFTVVVNWQAALKK